MNVGSGDKMSVILLPFNVTMEQPLDMTLFSITRYVLVNASDPGRGIRMTITMKRKIMSEMMTTYFPSLLLMMITYATTFFKPFFFEAALSVNLTTMLVMTTIFISKMEGLPPTSDIKMIDIWLIFCQLVPFAQVVLLTAMEFLREEEKEENQVSSQEEWLWAEPLDDNQEGSVQFEVEGAVNPKEAWTIATMKHSMTSFVPMLAVIGRFHVVERPTIKLIFFREESDSHGCTRCVFPLLRNCCKFLLRLTAKSVRFADTLPFTDEYDVLLHSRGIVFSDTFPRDCICWYTP